MTTSTQIPLLSQTLNLRRKSKPFHKRYLSFLIPLILLLALGTVGQAAVEDDALVVHYFDDLLDDSGNGHNAVLGGHAYISGGLLYLDGDEDYADIGPTTFGPVNPMIEAASDFTIAVAYACTSTATGEGGSMIVSVGPAAAMASGDLSLGTGNDGQYIDHWYTGSLSSNQSGVGYADGSVHMVILTYQASSDTYTFYHQTGSGGVSHGSGSLEWSAEWDAGLDYTPRLGAPRNATLIANEEPSFFPDMDGQIDYFAMWNRILTTAEMEQLAGGGGGPKVEILGDPNWVDESDLSRAEVAGPNRVLLFTAHVEDNDSPTVNLASVTYGGQAMTKVIDEIFVGSQNTYVVAYYLDEAGITAASGGTFVPNWGSNPPDRVGYSSVFLSGVDQTNPLGYALSAVGADYTVSTDPLPTRYGDMVILAGTCGDTGTYEVGTGSGFTEAIELSISQADGIAGYKSATGADETPSINHSTASTQALIGFVVQTEGGTAPDTTPPTPTTSTWSVVPVAISAGSITMTATNATDDSGVEYYFDFNEALGGPGGDDSGWQDSRTYTDYDLSPQTQYTYRVITRDKCPYQNTGNWSTSESATTPEATPPAEGCPEGDLTGDCAINWEDIKCLTDQWLVSDCTSIPPGCACADLDGHTLVDFNDYALLAQDWGKAGTGPVINELMPENDSNVQDPCGEYDDWFEIHNPTDAPIDINGMWVENDDRDWQIPESYIIPAGGFVVLWADRDTHQGPLHVDFRLDKDGDHIALYADDNGQPGTLIDTITFDDSDVQPDYSYGRFPDAFDSWYTMDGPTPGSTNTIGMAEPPYFSHPGGTFTTAFELGLTTKSSTAQIYYTRNGDEPTNTVSSTNFLYTAPFLVHHTNWVRARAYEPGLGLDPSYIVSRVYMKLHSDVESFQSNLPIVIIDSFGTDIDNANRDFHPVRAVFIDTDEITGTCAITDAADWDGPGGMHIRGASTASYPKRQFRFETWDENRPDPDYPHARYLDKAVSLLGLPTESDWIIHGPWSDRTQMRNYQMYTWSNLIGRYASRTVFVEVFLDYDGNGIIEWDTGLDGSGTDYRGIYILMEKIKRDDNRVDIERLEPQHNSEPEITGGYLLKKDWDWDFITSYYGDTLLYWDPEEYELTSTQKNWIGNYLDDFESALSGGNYNNPAHADYYGNYIDILSFVDHHILVELAKNVDGFVLSTYLSKDRGGKIKMGPIWDYNGSLGGADYVCSWDPVGWLTEAQDSVCCINNCCFVDGDWPLDEGQHYEWYLRLFTDPEFRLKYADQWFELREDVFESSNMDADISNNATLLTTDVVGSDAVERNFNRWDIDGGFDDPIWPDYLDNEFEYGGCTSAYPHTYAGHVQWLKDWLSARLTWMDSEIDSAYGDTPPEIFLNGSPADQGGHANVGDSVTITKTGGGTIYYTTDGNDPRNHGGGIYGDPYSPITLNKSVQIKARINNAGDWSALNEATFAVGPVADNLRITEMMYHPQDTGDPINDPNAEFIELKNIHGSTPINLNLVKFTDGIDFTFSDITLGPGSYIVVAKDLTVFASKYPGFSGTLVGPYTGRLNNAGERVILEDAIGQVILNFGFKDGWYHITDGSGFSLDANDPSDPDPNAWEYKEGWRASSVIKGTPGADDTGHVAATGDIVINEVMTHTDAPPQDWIELHNTTSSPIDIGGWFLSDNENDFKRYEIAPGTSIPGDGYIVFTEDANFGTLSDPGCHFPFALSEHGETVYLSSGSGGVLDGGFCAKEDFKAAENGVSFGRYTKSPATANDVDFVAMQSPTMGWANSDPCVGPIVISEIMYHPNSVNQLNNYAEYVELYNISGGSVSLDDWQLTDEDGGIEFYIPAGTSLPSGQYLLLVKNLVAFNSEFTPAGGVTILEWVEGRLSNAGEKIQISKPGPPEPDFVPYIRVDRVNYSDGSHPENFHELPGDPWPTDPDGGGQSLHRATPGNYGNDVANWVSGAVSPGS